MFGLRLTTDCQPRTKKGQPPQRTTGVARASSIHPERVRGMAFTGTSVTWGDIARMRRGMVRTRLTLKRRVMSINSGFSSSANGVRGSRAMPHKGHAPGASRTISGCIGQVHSVFGACGVTGSRAMPHFGQEPGSASRISGCIGQV
ncbi:MAG: hypothetical protein A4E57_04665 [Syntrophorhabdaceae bacterium PtaU1.Bin034]|nr:MAG: hypothetical protein A4E57_04665 [Syntrophorhabdaceae bacterium PtaU1.Bin034]